MMVNHFNQTSSAEKEQLASQIGACPFWVDIAATIVCHLPRGRYRLMNYLSNQPPPKFWRRTPMELGGQVYQCDLRDSISREVCFTGRYEPQETLLIQHLLKPGMTFVDVGANWGYFTLLAAHLVGTGGRVVSLEPDPRTYSLLEQNVVRNCLNHVCYLQVAAADKPGTLKLAGYTESGGNFGISRIVEHELGGQATFDVRATALDGLLDEIGVGAVDLLKMDIEGAEGWALAGLHQSLTEYRIHRLLLELHPAQLAEHGHSAQQIVAELQSMGYQAWKIDHSFAAMRRAAYRKRITVRDFVSPYEPGSNLDDWPHLVLAKPGLEPIC